MKAHKRLMASLTARGIAPEQKRLLTGMAWSGRLSAALAGHTHDSPMLPRLARQTGKTETLQELLQEARAGLNRAQRRELLFAPPKPVAGPAAPISVCDWLKTQPGSTRRGFARGRFTTLPKNVFLS